MCLTEYDQEKILEQERCDGMREFAHNVATDMLKDGKFIDEIKRYSKLVESAILKIANSLNITIQ